MCRVLLARHVSGRSDLLQRACPRRTFERTLQRHGSDQGSRPHLLHPAQPRRLCRRDHDRARPHLAGAYQTTDPASARDHAKNRQLVEIRRGSEGRSLSGTGLWWDRSRPVGARPAGRGSRKVCFARTCIALLIAHPSRRGLESGAAGSVPAPVGRQDPSPRRPESPRRCLRTVWARGCTIPSGAQGPLPEPGCTAVALPGARTRKGSRRSDQ